MTTETKMLVGTGIATIVIIVGGAMLFSRNSDQAITQEAVDSTRLVRENSLRQGNQDAKVTVTEFADFQCPACAAVHPILKQLKSEFSPEEVQFVFRHFPLESIHPNARISSQAAEAAEVQGKFWPMHDKLFEQQDDWAKSNDPIDIFAGYAEELELNVDEFRRSIDDSLSENRINQDQADGQSLRIPGTPTIFINDARFTDLPSYENLKNTIQAQLQ